MRNQSIEKFKLVAALLVIAIHTSPLESFVGSGDFILTRVVARIAVPFFLMITGYYVIPSCFQREKEELRINGKKLADRLGKLAALYGVAILLYLPVNIYKGSFTGLTFGKVLQELFFTGTFYHLWYLPAVMLGMVLTVALLRFAGLRWTKRIVVVLYVIGLLGDSYYGLAVKIPVLHESIDFLLPIMGGYTRNGLFLAPIFLLLGYRLSRREQKKASIWSFAITLTLMAVEANLVDALELPKHDSMYVLLPFCMITLFRLLLEQSEGRDFKLPELPMQLYILHPLCIVGLRGIVKFGVLPEVFLTNSLLYYGSVVIISLAAGLCCLWLCRLVTKRIRSIKERGDSYAGIQQSMDGSASGTSGLEFTRTSK